MGSTTKSPQASDGTNLDQKLSETYGCPEDTCLLTVGLILPNSKYSDKIALSCRDLAEKVAVAMSSKMTEEEKEIVFKKADDFMARPDKIKVSPELLKAAWKAVLEKCPHQAKAFKENLGKCLKKFEIQEIDMVYEMVAHLNNVHFMVVKNMDTVIAGGENAQRLKNAINANFWPMHNPDESELRAKVIFGSKIRNIIYVPNEKLLYGNGAQLESSTGIIMETLNYLDQCNDCNVIMLPIFRHLDHPEISQDFINWYKTTAATDSRLIGIQEIDEMKLIHWLHATPSNKDEIQHVTANGLLTELGTQKLVQYLNLLGYKWKHRELLPKENIPETPPTSEQPSNNITASACGKDNYSGRGNYRGYSGSRGHAPYRGKRNYRGFSINYDRDSTRENDFYGSAKIKVEKWLNDSTSVHPSKKANRRREPQQ